MRKNAMRRWVDEKSALKSQVRALRVLPFPTEAGSRYFSLRLGHRSALTTIQVVIHYLAAATLQAKIAAHQAIASLPPKR